MREVDKPDVVLGLGDRVTITNLFPQIEAAGKRAQGARVRALCAVDVTERIEGLARRHDIRQCLRRGKAAAADLQRLRIVATPEVRQGHVAGDYGGAAAVAELLENPERLLVVRGRAVVLAPGPIDVPGIVQSPPDAFTIADAPRDSVSADCVVRMVVLGSRWMFL